MTEKTMTQILSSQRVIAFNPMFADVAEDALAGLMLSQLCYWSDKGERKDGWIYKTQKEWLIAARLTRYNIETARKKLEKLGVISYKRMGVPAKGHYIVNYLILEAKVKEIYYKNNSLLESNKQESGNPTNKKVGIQQTRKWESNKQESGNPTNKKVGKQRTITESTSESTSESKQKNYSVSNENDLFNDPLERELLERRRSGDAVMKKDDARSAFENVLKQVKQGKPVRVQIPQISGD